ncbi:MAG: flagellar biosynthesis protein FliQ [Pseudomonadales bacterium]|nr:flagellar biosynthesis protein FliQ [Pseudomonadales bacterium]MCP5184760.1 flagellar biosynthesis protein FliQ [Pseudomonadales bacterium]
MTSAEALSLFGDGLFLVVILVSSVVLPSLVVGLIVSIFQAATQINEQTLSFLPRLLATLITLMVAGPWMVGTITEFTHSLFDRIPGLIG